MKKKLLEDLSYRIISRLPYHDLFLFVKEIVEINEDNIISKFWFNKDLYFYDWHFKHLAVTPGVFIIEMMGQAGPISHIIYLEKLFDKEQIFHPVVTDIKAQFVREIRPEEVLTIKSKKIYYRKNTIRSSVFVYNESQEICSMSELQVKLIYE